MPERIEAWRLGFADGMVQPVELTVGMTYGDRRDESYDAGVNVGQFVGRIGLAVRSRLVRVLP